MELLVPLWYLVPKKNNSNNCLISIIGQSDWYLTTCSCGVVLAELGMFTSAWKMCWGNPDTEELRFHRKLTKDSACGGLSTGTSYPLNKPDTLQTTEGQISGSLLTHVFLLSCFSRPMFFSALVINISGEGKCHQCVGDFLQFDKNKFRYADVYAQS